MGWLERVRRERSGRSTLSRGAMAYVGFGGERSGVRNPTLPALLFAGKAKPEQGRFNARKVGGCTRICGAEYPGGRGGHGVAGTFTAGIRNGAFPFRVILLDAPLRSSVETIPLYSCRRRSLPAGGFKGAALWAERAELRRRQAEQFRMGGC